MIKHVVCYKIKEEYLNELNKAKTLLHSMKDNIPYINTIETGVDVLHSGRSYDFILIITFNSLEDLDKYKTDSYHVTNVKPFMHQIMASSVSVDFNMED